MKLATMFGDVLHSVVRSPVTEQTPSPAPPHVRGRLHWTPVGCTGCALCVKDCPADAINLIRLDAKEKRFVLRYSLDRCTFCGQCVENCRFDCLSMPSDEWSLAALTGAGFTIYYGDEANVEQVLAAQTPGGDGAAGSLTENRGSRDRA